jgi:hypothetical protein
VDTFAPTSNTPPAPLEYRTPSAVLIANSAVSKFDVLGGVLLIALRLIFMTDAI